jgi:hypothetical protein
MEITLRFSSEDLKEILLDYASNEVELPPGHEMSLTFGDGEAVVLVKPKIDKTEEPDETAG